MTEAEKQRQADRAARTMFNILPQGTGAAIQRTIANAPNPAMMAGSAGVNPLTTANIPEFPSRLGPLIRTDYGERSAQSSPTVANLPSGTGGVYRPSVIPQPTQPSPTISVQDAIAANNANMSQQQRSFYNDWMRRDELGGMSSSAQGVVGAVSSQPNAITGNNFSLGTQPNVNQQISQARFGVTPDASVTIAPKTAAVGGATDRVGVRTAYGMVYPAAGQEAGAERSAALGPMGARLANMRQEMTQADRIAAMREQGAKLAQQRIQGQEQFFAQKSAERSELARATADAFKAGVSPQKIREARAEYMSKQPTTISGIQRQFAQMAPSFKDPMAERVAPIRQAFNIPTGGPQPEQGFASFGAAPMLNNMDGFGNPFSFSLYRPLPTS